MTGMDGKVRRHKWVKVEAQNAMGKPIKKKFEGWEARVFQHEYDHLEGDSKKHAIESGVLAATRAGQNLGLEGQSLLARHSTGRCGHQVRAGG